MARTDTPDFSADDDGTTFTNGGGLSPSVAARRHQIFPILKPEEIDRLRRFGKIHHWQSGELLFEAGKARLGMFVLLAGRVAINRHDGMGHKEQIAEQVPGEFVAEVGQLSARPSLVDGRAIGAVEALVIDSESLRALVIAEAELGERIMRALILRRVQLIETSAGGPILVGPANSARMVQLQGFLARNGHPHTVLYPDDPEAAALLAFHSPQPDELPLVVCPDGTVMKNPSDMDMGRCTGLLPNLSSDRTYDVIVVGAGPAGLATAVYAASEGLSALVLDAHAYGGQAGASSRIENYLGFPTGISGQALAGRAFVQAQKFGAEVALPATVERLQCSEFPLAVSIANSTKVHARMVVIASGANYRRPAIPELSRYESRGVYYWASPIEAKLCRMEEVVLVGGGNSAGQAAVFLAGHAAHVHMLVRGAGLAASMSSYLVNRIASIANIELHTETEIIALEGNDEGLAALTWQHRASGLKVYKQIRRVFLFVGADPNTDWLNDCGVALDDKGFVLTGDAPCKPDGTRSRLPLETSVPGVFAVGDVRAGLTKRVAAAVGEGAAVVAQLHTYLATEVRQSI